MTNFDGQALHPGFPKPWMQTSAALSETRHPGYEKLCGPVLSNSICGWRSTFSGLQSNELNAECVFLPKSHALYRVRDGLGKKTVCPQDVQG